MLFPAISLGTPRVGETCRPLCRPGAALGYFSHAHRDDGIQTQEAVAFSTESGDFRSLHNSPEDDRCRERDTPGRMNSSPWVSRVRVIPLSELAAAS